MVLGHHTEVAGGGSGEPRGFKYSVGTCMYEIGGEEAGDQAGAELRCQVVPGSSVGNLVRR